MISSFTGEPLGNVITVCSRASGDNVPVHR